MTVDTELSQLIMYFALLGL